MQERDSFRPPGTPPDTVILTFAVPRELAGLRLDVFIQNRLPRLSRTRAQAIVRSSALRKDGTRRRPSDRVQFGETIYLARPTFQEPETPQEFDVIFDDGHVLAVNKPAGLPVHPTATYHRNTLTWLLKEKYGQPQPQIAHRLDRETSGVLLCGRTPVAERTLKIAFEKRRVKKTYVAMVQGVMPEDRGRIELPLSPVKEGLHLLMEVRDDGPTSEAVTDYEVLMRSETRTFVKLLPHTGRQHQLRVHLSALGFPILGDKLYGPERERIFLEYIDNGMNPDLTARAGHWRHALHAFEIHFDHPETREHTTLRAPIPNDLRELWGAPSCPTELLD